MNDNVITIVQIIATNFEPFHWKIGIECVRK